MAPPNTNLIKIKAISKGSKFKTIEVRVLSLWQKKDYGKLFMDMILLDSEGSKIQATIPSSLMPQFKHVFKEGHVFRISNFLLADNEPPNQKGKVNHSCLLRLGVATKVIEMEQDVSIPQHGFQFVPFNAFLTNASNGEPNNIESQFVIDVIGQVRLPLGDIETIAKAYNKRKIDVKLVDNNGVELIAVLWESYADELIAYVNSRDNAANEPIVLILQFVIISTFQRVHRVTTMAGATKMHISPSFPEVPVFLRMHDGDASLSSQGITGTTNDSWKSNFDDYLRIADWKTIDELLECTELGVYTINAIIADVDAEKPWYYDACKAGNCNKKIDSKDKICKGCSKLKLGTDEAELLQRTKLIIWDEAPMAHRHCFEALDRSLRDIMRTPDGRYINKPFGGKVIVFGGDFRQILPVVPKGTRHDIVHAALCSSRLWNDCEVLKLTHNMRLQGASSPNQSEEIREFAQWLLDVGDGICGGDNDGEIDIKLPDDILIRDASNPIAKIVEAIYPDILKNKDVEGFFESRAVLAPTNEIVDSINEHVMKLFPGTEKLYLSSDAICKDEDEGNVAEDIFSPEFLNTIKCSGLPNHIIRLKVGCVIMLLRNLDQAAGLCNGTRLIVTRLDKHTIGARMISGKNAGTQVVIPRTVMSPSDLTKFPLRFQRRQFPVAVSFAMTINKSQGQSLSHVGLYLEKPVFSHGQLYVAFSRVTSKKGLKVIICDSDGQTNNRTLNVVYKEVFDRL